MSETGLVAYCATEDAQGLTGSVAIGEGETFDVGGALEEGDGTIVVVAHSEHDRALGMFEGMKRTDVPNGAEPVNPEDLPEEEIDATRAAADEASKLGLDLREIDGSGAGGRITIDDVRKAGDQPTAGAAGDDGEES